MHLPDLLATLPPALRDYVRELEMQATELEMQATALEVRALCRRAINSWKSSSGKRSSSALRRRARNSAPRAVCSTKPSRTSPRSRRKRTRRLTRAQRHSTFCSVRQAVMILSIVPFAMVGGIVALWVTGEYLSVPSVGFIALLGIAVLNGVVLVSYFNQLIEEGMAMRDVVVAQGARRRLRPVMTASITAFGLIPLLFASGPGSEIQRPLAIVVIGGLLSAMALTLVLLPILYARFAFAKDDIAGKVNHV